MKPGLFAAAVLAAIASLAIHVALNCPIDPVQSPPAPTSHYPRNNLLQRLEKLGEGLLNGPEDVYVDAVAGGVVYTATRDGWLHRMNPYNRSWERWRFVGGTGLLGIAKCADGSMLICDAHNKGLLRVGEEAVTLLAASEVEGSTINLPDAVVEGWRPQMARSTSATPAPDSASTRGSSTSSSPAPPAASSNMTHVRARRQ
ncbi:unnamed protein product [Urochloa decumbens]|uniref:Uncharacterized protein n=1 Tax=Urochloa decumbens TaxID=240449 RepID=A0ABC9CDI5_9POAL